MVGFFPLWWVGYEGGKWRCLDRNRVYSYTVPQAGCSGNGVFSKQRSPCIKYSGNKHDRNLTCAWLYVPEIMFLTDTGCASWIKQKKVRKMRKEGKKIHWIYCNKEEKRQTRKNCTEVDSFSRSESKKKMWEEKWYGFTDRS